MKSTVLVPPIIQQRIYGVKSIRIWSSGVISIEYLDGTHEGCNLPKHAWLNNIPEIIKAVQERRPDTIRTPLPIDVKEEAA